MRYKKPAARAAGSEYEYLNLPKKMDECFYKLKLKDVRESGKDNNKFLMVWEVLDTDTTSAVGSEISDMLDPNAEFAEFYFWRDIFDRYLALKGKVPSTKRKQKLLDKSEEIADALMAGKYNGRTAQVSFERITKKGKPRTVQDWQPFSEDAED